MDEQQTVMLPGDETARMTRLAEVIEELAGADYDTAAQLAHDVIVRARMMRQLEDEGHPETAVTPRLGQHYQALSLPPGSVVTTGFGAEYVISRRGLCMRWEQPIPGSGLWTVIYTGRLAAREWMTPRERAEVDEYR